MELTQGQWVVACLSAFFIGLSKTGVAGIGMFGIILFSSIVPARQSVGLVLVLLICADVVAVASYHRHAVWSHLWRLFPFAAIGVVAGYLAMGRIDEPGMRKLMGCILTVLVSYQLWGYWRGTEKVARRDGLWFAALVGFVAGFTTMVANAAGPVMVVYLLAMGLPKLEFVGTGAWYFLCMNLFKIPFNVSLGLINPASLGIDLWLAPFAVVGALWGRVVLKHIPQKAFELTALVFTLLASLKLLFF